MLKVWSRPDIAHFLYTRVFQHRNLDYRSSVFRSNHVTQLADARLAAGDSHPVFRASFPSVEWVPRNFSRFYTRHSIPAFVPVSTSHLSVEKLGLPATARPSDASTCPNPRNHYNRRAQNPVIMAACHRPGPVDNLQNRLPEFSILTWSTAALGSLVEESSVHKKMLAVASWRCKALSISHHHAPPSRGMP